MCASTVLGVGDNKNEGLSPYGVYMYTHTRAHMCCDSVEGGLGRKEGKGAEGVRRVKNTQPRAGGEWLGR